MYFVVVKGFSSHQQNSYLESFKGLNIDQPHMLGGSEALQATHFPANNARGDIMPCLFVCLFVYGIVVFQDRHQSEPATPLFPIPWQRAPQQECTASASPGAAPESFMLTLTGLREDRSITQEVLG